MSDHLKFRVADAKMSCNVGDLDEKVRLALDKFFNSEKSPPEAVMDDPMVKVLEMLRSKCQFSFDPFGHKCLELFEEEKPKIKQILKNLEGNISLSVDILSSGKEDNCGSEYLCLTAHFIDDNWSLKRLVLNFIPVGGVGENSAHVIILKSLKDWDIEDKISTITMVNSNRYDETLEIVKDHIRGIKELSLDGSLFRVYCCADNVNLVVQHAYESISEIVEKIGHIYPMEDTIPTWNNRSSDLKVAILTRDTGAFDSPYVREISAIYGRITKGDWNKVSDICDLVDDIFDLVFPLFEVSMGYPTANIFLHNLLELQVYLDQKFNHSNGFMRNVAEKMLQTLERYMKDMYLLLAIVSVMDPRLKTKYFEFCSAKLMGSEGDVQVSRVLEVVRKLYNGYAVSFPIKQKIASDSTPALLREYNQFVQSTTSQPMKSELDCYLEESVLPWSQNFNALTWWKVLAPKYPTLSRMARDFLAIPISIAVGDEGLLMEQKKVESCVISTRPDFTNAFMCIRSWFQKNQNQNSVLLS